MYALGVCAHAVLAKSRSSHDFKTNLQHILYVCTHI